MSKQSIQLVHIAHARSGDKGNHANIGLIAFSEALYPLIEKEVTAEKVKEFFADICKGEVRRYELPNLSALNFLLENCLGGGGTMSLRTDAQGKVLGSALLRMHIEVPKEFENIISTLRPSI